MCFITRNKSNEENLNLNKYYEIGEYWTKWWININGTINYSQIAYIVFNKPLVSKCGNIN